MNELHMSVQLSVSKILQDSPLQVAVVLPSVHEVVPPPPANELHELSKDVHVRGVQSSQMHLASVAVLAALKAIIAARAATVKIVECMLLELLRRSDLSED